MATKKNKNNRRLILVLLPVIIVLLTVLLTLIQRTGPAEKPVEAAVIEPEAEHESAAAKIIEPAEDKGTIYFVIDDVGYNIDQLEPFLALDCSLTFAILPFLPYSNAAARQIEQKEKEYIIHMPMEPVNGEDPGPGALYTSMEADEIQASAMEILVSLPGAEGVNNHMGSKFTSDTTSMDAFLQVLKQEGKFYLDSYTTAESVVRESSERNNMIYNKRDVFVDNTPRAEDMEKAIREGFVLAEKQGEAVLIGHVWSENLPGVIEKLYREGIEKGYRFAHLSELYGQEGSS